MSYVSIHTNNDSKHPIIFYEEVTTLTEDEWARLQAWFAEHPMPPGRVVTMSWFQNLPLGAEAVDVDNPPQTP